MPARVRTKRRSALPTVRISSLRPSTYNLRPGEVHTIVCPDCQTWQRIMGASTLTIRDHHATDLSGAELDAGQRDTRCPSARRVVLVDLTPDEITDWATEQDRPMKLDAMPAETRRAARRHYKPLPPAAPALHHIAERRETAPAPTGAARTAQWTEVLPAVDHTDMVRRTAVLAGHGEPRHLVYGAQVPTTTLHPAA
ncbi:hypothetical protein [Kitasatospora sp. NPDC085879]|uniref:hypothetical protein n=1 Tax=Kitasatospora sp. NPDC085879 TaxID=3154769 RepID=UPI003438347F